MKPTKQPNDKDYLVHIKINFIENVKVFQSFGLLTDFFVNHKEDFGIGNFELDLLNQLMDIKYRIIDKFYFKYVPFYTPFITKINELKEIYSKEINNAEIKEKKVFYGLLRRTVKLLMNSPYGKEAQREHDNIFITKDYNGVIKKEFDRKINFTNICGASFITAKTRSMILKLLIKFPNNILYGDTDCVHVIFNENLNQKQFENEINISNIKLGSGKIEIEAEKAKYIKKKCYALMKKDGTIKFKTAGYHFTNESFDGNEFFRGNEISNISLFSFRNKGNQIILTNINKKL